MDSIRLALRFPVAQIELFNLLPFPGTELYDVA